MDVGRLAGDGWLCNNTSSLQIDLKISSWRMELLCHSVFEGRLRWGVFSFHTIIVNTFCLMLRKKERFVLGLLWKLLFWFLNQCSHYVMSSSVHFHLPTLWNLCSHDSLLLLRPPFPWPRPARARIAAPTTAAAAAARPAGSNSAKQTSTSAGYRREPQITTWSNSASREYLPLCHDNPPVMSVKVLDIGSLQLGSKNVFFLVNTIFF